MKRKFKGVVVFVFCMLGMTGCLHSTQERGSEKIQTQETSQSDSVQQTSEKDEIEILDAADGRTNNTPIETETEQNNVPVETAEPNDHEINKETVGAELAESSDNFEMKYYTEAPNANSSVKIAYPVFGDSSNGELNSIIYSKVQEMGQIDTSFFSSDAALTVEYQSAVTLKNNKIASIIFWGESSVDGASYKTTTLISMNIDLQIMKEISLKDLYNTNEDFKKVFFEKAFFPENPITSYDESTFKDMLELQTPEYQTVDPFSIPGNIICFLKPEGIVLSMPSIHATGSDHFEAQLKYSDIQDFYLPIENYWDD